MDLAPPSGPGLSGGFSSYLPPPAVRMELSYRATILYSVQCTMYNLHIPVLYFTARARAEILELDF